MLVSQYCCTHVSQESVGIEIATLLNKQDSSRLSNIRDAVLRLPSFYVLLPLHDPPAAESLIDMDTAG